MHAYLRSEIARIDRRLAANDLDQRHPFLLACSQGNVMTILPCGRMATRPADASLTNVPTFTFEKAMAEAEAHNATSPMKVGPVHVLGALAWLRLAHQVALGNDARAKAAWPEFGDDMLSAAAR